MAMDVWTDHVGSIAQADLSRMDLWLGSCPDHCGHDRRPQVADLCAG